MDDVEELTCGVRIVAAPDGVEIPVPVGGIGLTTGPVTIREEAAVSIQVSDNSSYYVVVNNAEPSNDEADELFEHFTVEGAITVLEHLAAEAFSEAPVTLFKGAGLIAGVLVSLFTTSKLTQEVFIRATLPDSDAQVTYCLLV